eukprot:1082928-Rhodomonas_salina.1
MVLMEKALAVILMLPCFDDLTGREGFAGISWGSDVVTTVAGRHSGQQYTPGCTTEREPPSSQVVCTQARKRPEQSILTYSTLTHSALPCLRHPGHLFQSFMIMTQNLNWLTRYQ